MLACLTISFYGRNMTLNSPELSRQQKVSEQSQHFPKITSRAARGQPTAYLMTFSQQLLTFRPDLFVSRLPPDPHKNVKLQLSNPASSLFQLFGNSFGEA
jgi:hypothetical protein